MLYLVTIISENGFFVCFFPFNVLILVSLLYIIILEKCLFVSCVFVLFVAFLFVLCVCVCDGGGIRVYACACVRGFCFVFVPHCIFAFLQLVCCTCEKKNKK